MITAHATRRAAALLIVLAIVVAAVPLVAIAAARMSLVTMADRTRDEAALADDLLDASIAPVRDWLRRESYRVVLQIGIAEPMVVVMDDSFELDGTPVRLQLHAWDLQAMLPADVVRSGSPLRLTLPDDVRRRLDGLENDPDGLDVFPTSSDARFVFPMPGIQQPSLGALVSTAGRGRAQPIARLNVNTTPGPLLAQALRLAGRGGFDAIAERRARGERSGPPRSSSADSRGSRRIELTSTSNTWGIRVDIIAGSVRRSWWTVWTRVSGDWMLQRRTPILWEPHPEERP